MSDRRYSVKVTAQFFSEWMMSECVDNFHEEDAVAMEHMLAMDEADAEAKWDEVGYEGIHSWDRERVAFNVAMVRVGSERSGAQYGCKGRVTIYLTREAAEYAVKELPFHYDKWLQWGSHGYIRSAERVVRELKAALG